MALTPYVSDAVISQDVANALKMQLSALPAYYAGLVGLAHQTATGIINSRLAGRGFSAAQIAGWDQGAWLERLLATVETLRLAGMTENIPEGMAKLYDDWTAKDGMLDSTTVTMGGGVYQIPVGTAGIAASGAPTFDPQTFPIAPPGWCGDGNRDGRCW
jgi:hypothetical protein